MDKDVCKVHLLLSFHFASHSIWLGYIIALLLTMSGRGKKNSRLEVQSRNRLEVLDLISLITNFFLFFFFFPMEIKVRK